MTLQMANIKLPAIAFGVLCFILISEFGMLNMAEAQRPDCGPKCQSRCSKSWKPKMCHQTCNTCCQRCNGCVPPGPTANRDVCPCYGQMKTHGNRYKCP